MQKADFYLSLFSSALSNSQELISMFTPLCQHFVKGGKVTRHYFGVFILREM